MVLVVEDDADIREALESLLEWDHHVISLPNGAKAVEYLESALRTGTTIPEVILLDIAMPIMNGFEFRDWQRKHEVFSKIPVIVFSGSHWRDRDMEDLDVDYIIVKPVNAATLEAALKGCIKVFKEGTTLERKKP